MTQNASDVEIANQGFAAFRQDLNDVLEDITTLHSGTAAPSTTYANQWWYETDTDKLYIRNEDNDAWIELLTLDQANDHLATLGASITLDGTGNVSIDSGKLTVSSDDVLVGTTTTDRTADDGLTLNPVGFLDVSRTGNISGRFTRRSNDGLIVDFRKDSTNVGTIGAISDGLYIGSPQGTDAYIRFRAGTVSPVTSTGSDRDNALDLGQSSARWNDLYLGGGVYVGGTGSANKLDDYEEGTWTPTLSTGTATFSGAVYTKVGNIVTVSFSMASFSDRTSSNDLRVQGLPFNSDSSGNYISGGVMGRYVNSGGDSIVTYQAPNDNKLYFYTVNQNSNYASVDHNDLSSSSSFFYVTHTYRSA